MSVQLMNRVMLPFSAEEPCLFSTFSELQQCMHRALEGTKRKRPVVIYGVPSAGKSYLKHVLEERCIGVLDTDDLVCPAMERQARRLINVILRDHAQAPGRAWNAIARKALIADPHTLVSELAWDEFHLPTTVQELRQLARLDVDSKLAKAATYEGIDVVVTNLRNLEFYDFGFSRTPAQAECHISLFPGMQLALLQQWFADSQDTAARARVSRALGADEYILTC